MKYTVRKWRTEPGNRPHDTVAHIFGDFTPVKTSLLYGVAAPQEYLRPLPPTSKQPQGAGADDSSAGVWAGEQRQQGQESQLLWPWSGEAFGVSLLPRFEKG